MLAAMASNTDIVYVRLLEEGTEVMRPVPAVNISKNVYKLLATDDYDPAFEIWEFTPGNIVRCAEQKLGSETFLMALELNVDSV